MTSRGLVVTEEQEEVSGLPAPSEPPATPRPESPTNKRSPIADLLYLRWLEGLKLKWPSIMSS